MLQWKEKIVLYYIIGTFSLFILLSLCHLNVPRYSQEILLHSLQSGYYHDALVSSLAISIPMLIELSLDNFQILNRCNDICLLRWFMILGIFIPNAFIFEVAIPNDNVLLFWSLFNIQGLIIGCTSFCYLHLLEKSVWTFQRTVILLLLAGFAYGFRANDGHNINIRSSMGMLSLIFLLMTMAYYSFLTYLWISENVLFHGIGKMSSIQRLNVIYILTVLFGMFLYLAMLIVSINIPFWKMSIAFITIYNYFFTSGVLMVSVFQSRRAIIENTQRQDILEIKRIFVRYVSHEIRTPLNTVWLGLKLLQALLTKKQQLDYQNASKIISEIKSSCSTATDTLNDLLLYEKIEGGVLNLEPELIPVKAFLKHSMKPFHIQAQEANVVFLFEESIQHEVLSLDLHKQSTTNSDYYIKGDPTKLAQVIRNLISNAFKFTPKYGTIVVKVITKERKNCRNIFLVSPESSSTSLHTKISPFQNQFNFVVEDMIRVEVTDSGPGISHEDQMKLFGAFVQFNPNILQKGGGSGLGLWIARQIVDLHGGRMGVSSQGAGQGSTFYFELPVTKLDGMNYPIHRGGATVANPSYHPVSTHYYNNTSNETFHPEPNEEPPLQIWKELERQESFSNDGEADEEKTDSSSSSIKKIMSQSNLIPVKRNYSIDSLIDPKLHSCSYSYDNYEIQDTIVTLPIQRPAVVKEARIRVLIVDDSSSNRKMVRRLLEMDAGGRYHCLEAADGQEAVDVMRPILLSQSQSQSQRTPSYDLILMDFVMTQLDGPPAAAEIRSLGYRGVIVGLTGNALPADIQSFKDHGANHVLTKPLNMKLLLNIIKDIELSKSSLRDLED